MIGSPEEIEIEIANATAPDVPDKTFMAGVPKIVLKFINQGLDKQSAMILDYGAGKKAHHANVFAEQGWQVLAHDFGDNYDPRYHCGRALQRKYDLVYASNVLNVQSSIDMMRKTIAEIASVIKCHAPVFINYPTSSRKSDITVEEMPDLLLEQFSTVVEIGLSASAPVWMCVKFKEPNNGKT